MNINNNQNFNSDFVSRYPTCQDCFKLYTITIKFNKIYLYCDKCLRNKNYLVNDMLLNNIFNNQNKKQIFINEGNYNIECEKCQNLFCFECYMKHRDNVTSSYLHKYEKRNNNNFKFPKYCKEEKYISNNIRCEKCQKQYLSGIINTNISKTKKVREIRKELNKAKHYMEYYYNYLKNKIISELEEKIKIIEKSYSENYNYHRNLFNLVEKLLEIHNEINSEVVSKSLNNLTQFTYPKIEINNIDNLDDKIMSLVNFFQNSYMFSNQTEKPITNITNYQEFYYDSPDKIIQLKDHRILLYNSNSITIYNNYNFNVEISIPFGNITCVAEIGNNKLLIGSLYPHICCYKENEYILQQFPVFHQHVILNIILLKNKQILTSSLKKIIITNGSYPYLITNIIDKAPYYIREIKELQDGRIFYFCIHEESKFNFYNIKTKEEKVISNAERLLDDSDYILEIKNGILVFSSLEYLIVFNTITAAIETIIKAKEEIINMPEILQEKNSFVVIYKDSFDVFNCHTFQTIFHFSSKSQFISYYLILGNGTLLGIGNLYEKKNYEREKRQKLLEKINEEKRKLLKLELAELDSSEDYYI